MSGKHAVLAPSSAPVWGNCSGSVKASQHAPNIETDQTRAGTAAHWVGCECLQNWRDPDQKYGLAAEEWIGLADPDGTIIDEGVANGAQEFVDEVVRVTGCNMSKLLLEQRVRMPNIHSENWGTFDAALPLLSQNVVYMWDYKHGFVGVSPFENLQLIDYIAGLCNDVNISPVTHPDMRIVLGITQPHNYGADVTNYWETTLIALVPKFQQLITAARATFESPRLTTGSWCTYCDGLVDCPAAREAGYSFYTQVDRGYAVDDMEPRDLAVERSIIQQGIRTAKRRLEAIEDRLEHEIKSGKGAPTGLTLESKKGRLKWREMPKEQIIAIGSSMQVDFSKVEVKTPTQCLAACKGNEQALAVIDGLSFKPSTKLTLINQADSQTATAFAKK